MLTTRSNLRPNSLGRRFEGRLGVAGSNPVIPTHSPWITPGSAGGPQPPAVFVSEINSAILTWHTSDWIWAADKVRLGHDYSTKRKYQDWLRTRQELQLVEEIANGTKHFGQDTRDGREPIVQETRVSHGHLRGGLLGLGTVSYLAIETTSGVQYAMPVFRSAIDFWKRHMEELGIP